MTVTAYIGLGANLGDREAQIRDAVQALGRIPVRLRDWNADFASFSAHKVGGPLGVASIAWSSQHPAM